MGTRTGAKVGAFRYLTAEAVERSAVEVGMKYGATFQISLGEGTAAEGKPMLPFLDESRDRVWTVAMHAKVWAGHHRTNVS